LNPMTFSRFHRENVGLAFAPSRFNVPLEMNPIPFLRFTAETVSLAPAPSRCLEQNNVFPWSNNF